MQCPFNGLISDFVCFIGSCVISFFCSPCDTLLGFCLGFSMFFPWVAAGDFVSIPLPLTLLCLVLFKV